MSTKKQTLLITTNNFSIEVVITDTIYTKEEIVNTLLNVSAMRDSESPELQRLASIILHTVEK